MLIPLDAAQAKYSTDNIQKAVNNVNLNRIAITFGFAVVLCVIVFIRLQPVFTLCVNEAESYSFSCIFIVIIIPSLCNYFLSCI